MEPETFSILSEIIILLIRTPNEPLIIILIIDKQKMLSHKDLTHARYSRVNPLLRESKQQNFSSFFNGVNHLDLKFLKKGGAGQSCFMSY